MHKIRLIAATGLLLAGFSAPAFADASADDLQRLINAPDAAAAAAAAPAPAQADSETLRLTPNKNEIIRLDQDASSVVVNNPRHASVMLDSPRLLIVMPRLPGTTSFTVLNANGEVVLQKDVIVTSVQPRYVRVRRICAAGDSSCTPAAYYYCPDGCYEITPVAPGGDSNIPPPPAGPAASVTSNDAPAAAPDSGGN